MIHQVIDRSMVVQKILDHLNGQLSDRQLVAWAEDAMLALSESETTQPHEGVLLDVVGFLGAADSPGFPLTWSVLADHLERLGVRVRVVLDDVA